MQADRWMMMASNTFWTSWNERCYGTKDNHMIEPLARTACPTDTIEP